MTRLELSDEEALMLRELLETRWEDVLKEQRHTDHRDFRGLLKRKADMLERMIQQLSTVGVAVARAR